MSAPKSKTAKARRSGKPRGPARNGRGNGSAPSNGAPPISTDEVQRVAAKLGQAVLIETSAETALHSDDVELIAAEICSQMEIGDRPRQDVLAAARLHDIGKSAIRQDVLEKPGPLNKAEWEEMRQHTIVGERILGSVQELKGVGRLVRHSHERWDGKGYPDGLAGGEIPLGSRIIFCADAFHAIRSDRPYRDGRSAQVALDEVKRCAGTQFDPTVVAALDEAVRELRLLPPSRRARRSSRLTALLLVLALGAGGTAVGRSDLLGPVPSGSAQSGGLPSCTGADCALFGPLLTGQLEGLGFSVPGAESNTADTGSGATGGGGAAGVVKRGGSRGGSRNPKTSGVTAPAGIAPGRESPSGSGSGSGGGGASSGGGGASSGGGNSGSSGGSSSSGGETKPSKPAKPPPPRGPKPGQTPPSSAPGVGNQGQGGSDALGTGNGNANPGSFAGDGNPGNSGNAPGHNK